MVNNQYWWEDEKFECDICKGFLATPEERERQICDNCWEDNDSPYQEYLDSGVAPGVIKEKE